MKTRIMDNLYIDKVLSGDHHAFRYFIHTYKDMVFSVAISIVKQEHLAKEVSQEAFLQAYLSLSNFKRNSKFSTWLYRIVVHMGYRLLRKEHVDVVEFELIDHDVNFENQHLERLLQDEQRQLINESLMKLPANESLGLRLFYLEELSIQEIMEITGWTESNTKVILYRGRKHMHVELSKLMKENYYGV